MSHASSCGLALSSFPALDLNPQARILVHGKVTHLGYYVTEEEAARAYDRVRIVKASSLATASGMLLWPRSAADN